jgi:hypothetical protein
MKRKIDTAFTDEAVEFAERIWSAGFKEGSQQGYKQGEDAAAGRIAELMGHIAELELVTEQYASQILELLGLVREAIPLLRFPDPPQGWSRRALSALKRSPPGEEAEYGPDS